MHWTLYLLELTQHNNYINVLIPSANNLLGTWLKFSRKTPKWSLLIIDLHAKELCLWIPADWYWAVYVCMVSWLDVRSDLNVYASCDPRYLEVSCETLFAFLFLILNKAFSVAVQGVYELLQDILLRGL